MGFFKRISDIISANLEDMADQFEDPEVMLRQAIREMEESVAEVTQQTAKAMASQKTLRREMDRNRQQVSQWEARAAQAVKDGDDDLARKALARKAEHKKVLAALEDQSESSREASDTLRRQLDAMKAKVAEAKRNLGTLVARKRAADFRKRMDAQAVCPCTDVGEDAFAKFDRLRSRVEQAEAEAEALAELRGQHADLGTSSERSAAEEDSPGVEVELAELKSRLAR